jgi:hypothetical protein
VELSLARSMTKAQGRLLVDWYKERAKEYLPRRATGWAEKARHRRTADLRQRAHQTLGQRQQERHRWDPCRVRAARTNGTIAATSSVPGRTADERTGRLVSDSATGRNQPLGSFPLIYWLNANEFSVSIAPEHSVWPIGRRIQFPDVAAVGFHSLRARTRHPSKEDNPPVIQRRLSIQSQVSTLWIGGLDSEHVSVSEEPSLSLGSKSRVVDHG